MSLGGIFQTTMALEVVASYTVEAVGLDVERVGCRPPLPSFYHLEEPFGCPRWRTKAVLEWYHHGHGRLKAFVRTRPFRLHDPTHVSTFPELAPSPLGIAPPVHGSLLPAFFACWPARGKRNAASNRRTTSCSSPVQAQFAARTARGGVRGDGAVRCVQSCSA